MCNERRKMRNLLKKLLRNVIEFFKCAGIFCILLVLSPFILFLYVINADGLRDKINRDTDNFFKEKALAKKTRLPFFDYKGTRFRIGDKIKLFYRGREETTSHVSKFDYDENKEVRNIRFEHGPVVDVKMLGTIYILEKIECRKGPSWL